MEGRIFRIFQVIFSNILRGKYYMYTQRLRHFGACMTSWNSPIRFVWGLKKPYHCGKKKNLIWKKVKNIYTDK